MTKGAVSIGGAESASDTAPPVPPEIKEAARLAPDHWLGMVDPAWSGKGEPPDWAVVGQWRSGLDGEIEEWRANEEYRPLAAGTGPAGADPRGGRGGPARGHGLWPRGRRTSYGRHRGGGRADRSGRRPAVGHGP
ncbi:hypothetical protein [Streptomyces sp. NBC_00445]|uniref:hypothetical protein n=1 Tax=Streptomyces sp. NBC_00445 TaxID=2975745 RepID=UPI003FCEDCDA